MFDRKTMYLDGPLSTIGVQSDGTQVPVWHTCTTWAYVPVIFGDTDNVVLTGTVQHERMYLKILIEGAPYFEQYVTGEWHIPLRRTSADGQHIPVTVIMSEEKPEQPLSVPEHYIVTFVPPQQFAAYRAKMLHPVPISSDGRLENIGNIRNVVPGKSLFSCAVSTEAGKQLAMFQDRAGVLFVPYSIQADPLILRIRSGLRKTAYQFMVESEMSDDIGEYLAGDREEKTFPIPLYGAFDGGEGLIDEIKIVMFVDQGESFETAQIQIIKIVTIEALERMRHAEGIALQPA